MATEFIMDFSQYELSEEQKFLFDLKGYIVFPGVFNKEQVDAIRQQVVNDKKEKTQTVPGGASEVILSNPIVKGTLKALIGAHVRMDALFSVIREQGQSDFQAPHQGGPMRNPHFHYHFTQGQSFSGLTRMVVELNAVNEGDGGTIFLPGSHKANLPIPAYLREKRDFYEPPFEGYVVPPGSVIFFSENTCHAGPVWNNPDHPRIAILFAFCDIGMRWHRHHYVPADVIENLGPEARYYFRDVWPWDNSGTNGGRNLLLVNDDGSLTVSP